MKKIQVTVTEDDINQGQRRRSRCCPIALAFGRLLGPDPSKRPDLQVTDRSIYVEDTKSPPTVFPGVELPPSAVEFIQHFDEDVPVEPFTFTVEIDDKIPTIPEKT